MNQELLNEELPRPRTNMEARIRTLEERVDNLLEDTKEFMTLQQTINKATQEILIAQNDIMKATANMGIRP